MNLGTLARLFPLTMALCLWSAPAFADTAQATCKVKKEGETKQKASGPCTFSQRQGTVSIDLRNGDSYTLSPGNKANHFKDQKGKSVERTAAGGNEHVYRWDNGRKIIVTFGSQSDSQRHGQHGSYESGKTPHALSDLVHGKKVGGEVDDELSERGYRHVKNEVSGDDVWSNWKNDSTKNCVTVHFNEGRVESIVNAPEPDCRR